MNLNEKLCLIADHYGLEIQATKLAEEGSELSAAYLKARVYDSLAGTHFHARAHFNKLLDKAAESLAKELADVLLLARQIEYLKDQEPEFKAKVERLMEEKADRQLKRIEEEKSEAGHDKTI